MTTIKEELEAAPSLKGYDYQSMGRRYKIICK
jgi:hypothetical protein